MALNYSALARMCAAFALSASAACATYHTKLGEFRESLRAGRPAVAAEKVREKAFAESDDQVVYLLEYATARQAAGDFAESTKAFLKAEDLTEIKDYHSISRVTGSLLLNQGMVQYKGEDFEKVLINAMLAINFLMQNDPEAAQVECRKLNNKLYKYKFEGKRNYQQNPFAFYLSALIWEDGRNWDSAYIDFMKAYELNPGLKYLREDLIRAARAARRDEDLAKWRKAFPDIRPTDLGKKGEVVLLYQQGWGPVKKPNPSFPRVPKLYPSFARTAGAKLEIAAAGTQATVANEIAQVAVDITTVASQQLDEQYSGLVAKRVAGLATKAVVSDQLRQQNQLLGDLAWIGLNIADQADLRQWISLPATFQIAKLSLVPGTYNARIVGIDSSGGETGEASDWFEIKVAARKKTFLNWRSFQ